MRTINVNLYQFSELSEEAKQRAIEANFEINMYLDWWKSVYEDANEIGLKITSFYLDRNRHAKGEFMASAEECANLIIKNHGEQCETFKTASQYLKQRGDLVCQHSDGGKLNIVAEENEYDFDCDCDALDEEFLHSILEDYSILLQNEYEYRYSDEAIIEAIEANGHEFTSEGEMY